MHEVFEPILHALNERDRARVEAAFAAVEYSTEPVSEAQAPALQDAILRRSVADMLHAVGRELVAAGPYTWTSGYRDDIAARLAATGTAVLAESDRAVLTLVLVYSVAMARAEGKLDADTWMSPFIAPMEDLQRRTQVSKTALRESLERLRAAGLVRLASGPTYNGVKATGYIPGPQFHRLTKAARTRLQNRLILAAAPDSPLAAAIRARRGYTQEQD
ncbi:hypothetical protein [Glycomyces sp. NPDC047010]|uniref:hypothetical protein n=1 Tax=Glycomyces sp. NPDC047010 TaxID=3155023 RepID=UPI0033D21A1B